MSGCNLCPRNCGADRRKGTGYCGEGQKIMLARAALHFYEEPCISGSRGSGAVFFCGCNMHCVFCQNNTISGGGSAGKEVSKARLFEIFEELISAGAHNINLVTPTHYTDVLADILDKPLSVPVVYNCGGYEKPESLRLLEGKIKIFMPDFKYYDNSLAEKYSHAPHYRETAAKAIEEMYRQTGPFILNNEGILQSGVLIRHLVLPGQVQNTISVIDYINKTFGDDILFSLMFQYVPVAGVPPELSRRVSRYEYDKITDYLFDHGPKSGYVQDLSSSSEKYIPAFDGTGL
jgi:radical SAM domain protein